MTTEQIKYKTKLKMVLLRIELHVFYIYVNKGQKSMKGVAPSGEVMANHHF